MADAEVVLRITAAAVLVGLALAGVWAARRSGARSAAAGREMTALEHVEELRRRLLLVLVAWAVATALVFSVKVRFSGGGWPYPWPAIHDNVAAQVFRIIADYLLPEGVQLTVYRPFDGFLAEMYVALGLGVAISLPVLLGQTAAFFGPALRPTERRAFSRALLPAMLLFAAGAAFCWRWVLPFVLETLYGYGEALDAQLLLSPADLMAFAVTFLVVFGVAFQLPLIMYVVSRVGLVSSRTFVKGWRFAVVAILIVAALASDPTVISQIMVAGPLLVLYFLGALAARMGERRGAAA